MWLAERQDVTGIGVDTISLDPGNYRPSRCT
jgi:kynurenine formamidase